MRAKKPVFPCCVGGSSLMGWLLSAKAPNSTRERDAGLQSKLWTQRAQGAMGMEGLQAPQAQTSTASLTHCIFMGPKGTQVYTSVLKMWYPMKLLQETPAPSTPKMENNDPPYWIIWEFNPGLYRQLYSWFIGDYMGDCVVHRSLMVCNYLLVRLCFHLQ